MRKLALVLLLLAGCTPSSPAPPPPVAVAATANAQAPNPQAGPAPMVVGERTPLGDAPRTVAEPAALDRSSPAAVIRGLEAAIERKDAAAIARLRASTASKPALDERDTLRARLDFLGGRAAFWNRVFAAIQPGDLDALDTTGFGGFAPGPARGAPPLGLPSGSSAKLHVVLGGSLGALDLGFTREGDTWLAAF